MNPSTSTVKARNCPRNNAAAFTLTELLVILATMAVMVLVLAPALAATKPNSKMAQCLNGKRQLTLAWQMYAADNSDSLVTYTWISQSSYMDWTSSPANTNTAYLTNPTNALIASYIQSAAVFKCPADYYQSAANPGPRVRSVSLNGPLGGFAITVEGPAPGGGQYYGRVGKMNYLSKPGPAATFVFLDEHADSINDGSFVLDPGYPPGQERWRGLPAGYHNGAAGISFADGHTEMHLWMAKKWSPASFPVLMQNYGTSSSSPWGKVLLGVNADYEWLDAHMPYR